MKRRSFVQSCLAVLGFGAVAKASEPASVSPGCYARIAIGETRKITAFYTTATDSVGKTSPVKVVFSPEGVPSVTMVEP